MVFWIFLDLAQDLDLSGQTLMASSLVFRRVGNSEDSYILKSLRHAKFRWLFGSFGS
ncbi:hypothetical protein RhiirC2_801321 [Rhizophagus irregularis]|uniref:Uncharacterized protein n=1 Tax=Rhizophagus irregularis TaxID=588596 RepID=A0A2N1M2K7_9GLOM|nr:hypothetical protein RhiirC2_801321 [Rhizophagus irregularis]